MSGHTPGPWIVVAPGADWMVQCSDGRSFLIGDAIYHPENRANARLIAAAPDLLAACIGMLRSTGALSGNPVSDTQAEAAARAAIAKAEGR